MLANMICDCCLNISSCLSSLSELMFVNVRTKHFLPTMVWIYIFRLYAASNWIVSQSTKSDETRSPYPSNLENFYISSYSLDMFNNVLRNTSAPIIWNARPYLATSECSLSSKEIILQCRSSKHRIGCSIFTGSIQYFDTSSEGKYSSMHPSCLQNCLFKYLIPVESAITTLSGI